jgi:hypothetical protein
MADGIYVNGRRPVSKKAIREALAADPATVEVESTSMFGGYSGPVSDLPAGRSVTFVGPDPYRARKFYGTITVGPKGPRLS